MTNKWKIYLYYLLKKFRINVYLDIFVSLDINHPKKLYIQKKTVMHTIMNLNSLQINLIFSVYQQKWIAQRLNNILKKHNFMFF